jgi:hypothetical protein
MKRLFALAPLFVVLAALTTGCKTEEAKKVDETTVSTPEGETTVTEEVTVETSGDNPPPADAP